MPGLEIKPLDRWTMITTLLAQADPDAPEVLRAEQAHDTTGDGTQVRLRGRRRASRCRYQEPNTSTDYLENRAQHLAEDWIERRASPAFNYLEPGRTLTARPIWSHRSRRCRRSNTTARSSSCWPGAIRN